MIFIYQVCNLQIYFEICILDIGIFQQTFIVAKIRIQNVKHFSIYNPLPTELLPRKNNTFKRELIENSKIL